MPKAIRYRANGKPLRNSLFRTNADFIGAYHGVSTDAIYDPILAAEEEALTFESHKHDLAVAFGIPVEEIEVEVLPFRALDDAGMPALVDMPDEATEDSYDLLPVEPAPPAPPTLEQKVDALIAALPAHTQTAIAEILKG